MFVCHFKEGSKVKPFTTEDALGVMASGFLRGGFGFLKGSEMIKGSSVSREVRVGVTHVSIKKFISFGNLCSGKSSMLRYMK